MFPSEMGKPLILVLSALCCTAVENSANAATNTPYPAGTAVVVLTPNHEIAGTPADIDDRGWVAVLEAGAKQATVVPLGSVEAIRGGVSQEVSITVPAISMPESIPARTVIVPATPLEASEDAIPAGALALVSWNIQTGGTSPNPDALRPKLVEGALSRILGGRYQTLAAQEIANADGAERLRAMLPGGESTWQALFRDTSGRMDNGFWHRSDIGRAVDLGVLFTQSAAANERPETDPSRAVHPPHAAHFTVGDFDFTVISVHLTFQGGDTEESAREMVVLLDFLDEYFGQEDHDPDVIICGDFNTPSVASGESGLTLDEVLQNDGRFEAGPHALHVFVDEKTSRSPASKGGLPARNYDHFIVSEDCLEELIDARRLNPAVLTDDPRDPKMALTSDHFPIVAYFRTLGDRVQRDLP